MHLEGVDALAHHPVGQQHAGAAVLKAQQGVERVVVGGVQSSNIGGNAHRLAAHVAQHIHRVDGIAGKDINRAAVVGPAPMLFL